MDDFEKKINKINLHIDFVKQFAKRKLYKTGDVCWNCGKRIKNPKMHYPIASGIFCREEYL